jgi:hypothetical protein
MFPRPTKPIFVAVVVVISHPPFDCRDLVLIEREVGGADDRVYLIGAPKANDRSVDGRIEQGRR